jgi:phage major head subunit gpT-like protein
MRTEFITAYESSAAPAAWLDYTTVIPSTARFEHYPWLSPTPAIAQYKGHRRVGRISETKYTVENLEFDDSFEVLLRDIDDDQTGGYSTKSRELAEKAKKFPGRWVLQHVAQGKTKTCFDGSAFFADSHTIGSGDNLMAGTATGSAGTYNLIALITAAPVKPLIYQERKTPELMDDMGTQSSSFSKVGRFWVDMEGAAAFGRWQDAILMEFTAEPTLTELQTALGQIEDRFRTFQLPLNLAGETAEYLHEQLVFSPETCTLLCSTNLSNKLRQILTQDTIVNSGAAITNIYKGFAKLVPTGLINTVS